MAAKVLYVLCSAYMWVPRWIGPTANRSTLGEEFCDLIAVSDEPPPGSFSRTNPFRYSYGPLARQRMASDLIDLLPFRLRYLWYVVLYTFLQRRFATRSPLAATCLEYATRAMTALFYLRDGPFSFAHLSARMEYRSLRRAHPQDPDSQPGRYRTMGVVLLLSLAIRLVHRWWLNRQAQQQQQQSPSGTAANSDPQSSTGGSDPRSPTSAAAAEEAQEAVTGRCSLCLGARNVPTATKCGHMFCWQCVSDWIASREGSDCVCPLCRQEIDMRTLVPLRQYRVSQTPVA